MALKCGRAQIAEFYIEKMIRFKKGRLMKTIIKVVNLKGPRREGERERLRCGLYRVEVRVDIAGSAVQRQNFAEEGRPRHRLLF